MRCFVLPNGLGAPKASLGVQLFLSLWAARLSEAGYPCCPYD
jgi:hypothetical protein